MYAHIWGNNGFLPRVTFFSFPFPFVISNFASSIFECRPCNLFLSLRMWFYLCVAVVVGVCSAFLSSKLLSDFRSDSRNSKFEMAPKYILYYFDLSGRGEGIRYLLHYKKIDFEDRRISFEQWPALKSQMPAGQMPVLEVNGKKLTQSAAILRYLGNEHGLTASGAWDNAKLDEAVDAANDLTSEMGRWYDEEDEKKKETIRGEIKSQKLPPKLDSLLRITNVSETHPFINGSKPTWADFYVAGLLTYLNETMFRGQLATTNKSIADYLNRVCGLEGVKEYIAQRPTTLMA